MGYWGFFLQDDWKINSRLTLNAGLRWELFGAPTFPNPEEQTVIRYLTYINGVPLGQESFTRPTGSNDCGCKNDFDNFAPRLGIAYRITDRTVFRAGGGIYYGEADNTQSETARFYTGAPLATEINLSQFVTREDTTVFVQEGFPVFVPGDLAPGSSVNTTPDFMPTFYAGQWFADLQQNLPGNVLLTIGYNGTKSTHLWSGRNLNDPLAPHPTIRAQDRRTWPQFNNVTLHDSFLNASFNSLTIKGERRFIKGFTFLSSFTWSHNINYGNENLEQGGSGRAWDWNIALDKGDANLDRRLASVTSVVYELPFGKGKQWLQSGPGAWVLGGWELGGIVSFLSGVPVDHSINVDNQNLGGRVRGDWVANPNLPASERTIDRWFNTEFVVPSGPGVISNAGRNVIRAPGTSNLDVLVARNFALPWEGHSLQFRFESFNFTNTPKFGVPNTSVGTPGVGRITEADDPRRIQFALKYYF